MIKITDGINTKNVTMGMYRNLYSNMGYKPVDAINESKKEVRVEQPKIEEPKKEEVRKERPNGKK